MTAEEVKKYINQIAFSGAAEFLEKFEKANDTGDIIGKFGLGFYSAFMVAGKVEIESLFWQEGADSVHVECDGSTSFRIKYGKRKERGTTIILKYTDHAKEFMDKIKKTSGQ